MAERCAALLRAVNVGGRSLAMAELRTMLTAMGCSDVQTILQSGNAVFVAPPKRAATIGAVIENAIHARFAVQSDVFIRSAADIASVIAANPYPREARDDPARLVVFFLAAPPAPAEVAAAEAAIVGRETLRAIGTHLYVRYPDGQGSSKLTNAVLERKLGVRGTARNWNTVLRIASALGLESVRDR